MFTLKNELLSGVNTEIISYESNSDLHILIFPGNPGIGSLYKELSEILIQKLNRDVNIHLISYAGFTKKKAEKMYSLQEELSHKIEVVNHLRKNWNSNSRVVFVGHSIGAWIAKELVKTFKKELNPTVFMLFPFFAKSGNKMQESFSSFLANENYTGLFIASYRLLRKLPVPIINSFIKLLYSHASEKAGEVILEYFISEKHIVENIFYLANTEFQKLANEVELEYFTSHKDSTILFYCADDMWAPLSQLEFLKSNISDINAEILPMTTHDFCVSSDQCALVAAKIVEYLK